MSLTWKQMSTEDLAIFAKRKGFVYRNSDIYGGLAGVYDYGWLGVEMRRNILNAWWKHFVTQRHDILGIDGATITSRKVWEASGHTKSFTDPIVQDRVTKKYYRADHLIEDQLHIPVDNLSIEEIDRIIREHELKSPEGNPLGKVSTFNLMFPLTLGATSEGSNAFLRGETAQLIFINFKNILDTGRVKLPFGIAQIGRAYRNEISPRDWLFRQREFTQMEIEYFHNPAEGFPLYTEEHATRTLPILTAEAQAAGKQEAESIRIGDLVEQGILNKPHAYWLLQAWDWFIRQGIRESMLRVRQHTSEELSHYSHATFDIEYAYPFGYKELFGIADRGDYDLRQHAEASGVNMHITLPNGEKIIPHVIEPSFGFDRFFMALLLEAYHTDEKGNTVLVFKPHIAPYQAAVFPLLSNKPELIRKAEEVFTRLLMAGFNVFYDHSGSIGRRYARQDEAGTPYCVTIDFQTLTDDTVTLRDRNTKQQERIPLNMLPTTLHERILHALLSSRTPDE